MRIALAAILKYWLLDLTLTNPIRISGGGDWASVFTSLICCKYTPRTEKLEQVISEAPFSAHTWKCRNPVIPHWISRMLCGRILLAF